MESASAAEPASSFYTSQGLRLHYAEWGRRDAPPLLLQHGGNDHCRSWDWVANRLKAKFRVIAPDLRGHGDSQWSPDGSYSLAVHTYDFAELIRQLDCAPVTIIAHSLGAMIALRYCGLFPDTVSRLVAIEGFMPQEMETARMNQSADERMRAWIKEFHKFENRRHIRFATIDDALAQMRLRNRHLSLDRARHLTQHGLTANSDGTFSWKFDYRGRVKWPPEVTRDELHALWARVQCPTLIVYGTESAASKSNDEDRLRRFRDVRVARIAGAGHWVHHDQFDAFMTEVDRFLSP